MRSGVSVLKGVENALLRNITNKSANAPMPRLKGTSLLLFVFLPSPWRRKFASVPRAILLIVRSVRALGLPRDAAGESCKSRVFFGKFSSAMFIYRNARLHFLSFHFNQSDRTLSSQYDVKLDASALIESSF